MTPEAETGHPSRPIHFARQLRVVSDNGSGPKASGEDAFVVEHDGQLYPLPDLLRPLTLEEAQEIVATAHHSNQMLWDEAVRRWPELTAEIVAGAKPYSPLVD